MAQKENNKETDKAMYNVLVERQVMELKTKRYLLEC